MFFVCLVLLFVLLLLFGEKGAVCVLGGPSPAEYE